MNIGELIFLVLFSIVIGAIVGALARLLVPGTARFGILPTILIGTVAALIGAWLGHLRGWSGLVTSLVQLGLAVIGVLLVRKPASRT